MSLKVKKHKGPQARLHPADLTIRIYGKSEDEIEILVQNVKRAVNMADVTAEIRTEIGEEKAMNNRIFITPGMLINGKRVLMGHTGTPDEIQKIIFTMAGKKAPSTDNPLKQA